MSKFVKVKTQLRDVALVKQALDDLEIQYEVDQQYTHYLVEEAGHGADPDFERREHLWLA